MRKYGTDKPDLRNPIEMQDVTEHFRGSGFKVFAGMIANDPKVEVWAIPPRPAAPRFLRPDELLGAGPGPAGPRLHLLAQGRRGRRRRPDRQEHRRGAHRGDPHAAWPEDGDACFFAAGDPAKFAKFAGDARARAGEELDPGRPDRFELAGSSTSRSTNGTRTKRRSISPQPVHHAAGRLDALENEDPLNIKAWQYDLVCNGFEIASGSIRNQSPEVMVKAFGIVGSSQADVEERFGGLYRAFQYGAPPHGGMAAGVDRIDHAAGRRQEPARSDAVPDEPAGRGPADGRAGPASPAQMRELRCARVFRFR
jgi:aspartyl-tRNA synthetase